MQILPSLKNCLINISGGVNREAPASGFTILDCASWIYSTAANSANPNVITTYTVNTNTAAWMFLLQKSVTVTVNKQHLLHQLRLQLCNQRTNWNDNCDCPTGEGITYSIDGATIPTLLEYLLMWLLQRIQLR
jgi:hypothetical protein